MIILDRLLIGSIRWVLEKVAAAVDSEMNDDSVLRQELLAAQMKLELGEMSEEEFAQFETDILARLREILDARGQGSLGALTSGDYRVTGVEAELNVPDDAMLQEVGGHEAAGGARDDLVRERAPRTGAKRGRRAQPKGRAGRARAGKRRPRSTR